MEPIRIVLIDMPPLLRDIVRNAIAGEAGLDVVSERALAELQASVAEDDPDFVIAGSEAASQAVRTLVRGRCRLRALEVHDDGKECILYELRPHREALGEISRQKLVETVRAVPKWQSSGDAAPGLHQTS